MSTKKTTKIKLHIKDGTTITLQDFFNIVEDKYDVHWAAKFEYEDKIYVCFQSPKKMSHRKVLSIFSYTHPDIVTDVSDFDNLGIITERIGTFNKRGRTSQRVKGIHKQTVNNITNNIQNITNIHYHIHYPNALGEETIDHISGEDMEELVEHFRDHFTCKGNTTDMLFLKMIPYFVHSCLMRELSNCNLKGGAKDANYKYRAQGLWITEHKKHRFVDRVYPAWFKAFEKCRENNVDDMEKEIYDVLNACIEFHEEYKTMDKSDYYKRLLAEGTCVMENMKTRVKFAEEEENMKLDGYLK